MDIIKSGDAVTHGISQETIKKAKNYYSNSLAANTIRSYANDIVCFGKFCKKNGLKFFEDSENLNFKITHTIPPEIIATYLVYLIEEKKYAVSTLGRRLAGIQKLHTSQNLPSPVEADIVKGVHRGIKRTFGTRKKQAKAIRKTDIARAITKIDTKTKKGIRDKAIILIGYCGAFRRSELANLQLEDITFVENKGMEVFMGKSKTDQKEKGMTKVISSSSNKDTCPVTALVNWLKVSQIKGGRLFPTVTCVDDILYDKFINGNSINRMIKEYFGKKFSGHSLRVGICVELSENNMEIYKIQRLGGWKTAAMPVRYTKQANEWKTKNDIFQ